jgi:hypothetical protein
VDQLQHFWHCKRGKQWLHWGWPCTTSITRGVVIREKLEYSHDMTGPSLKSDMPSPVRRRNVCQESKNMGTHRAYIVNQKNCGG